MNNNLGSLDAVKEHAIRSGMPADAAATLLLHEEMGFTVAYRPGTSDEGVLEHSFARDIFLSGVPEYQPCNDHVVVEVGGHLGDFALLVSRLVGRVYTIEARQETFGLLSTNLRLNTAGNVIADRLAISDSNDFVTLYHAPEGESWGDSTTLNFNGTSETVPARTLARYLFERNIAHVDFMKFNCEGAEFPILLSADRATLAKVSLMLVLFHGDLVEGHTGEMLAAHLRQAGFMTAIRQQYEQRGWIIATRSTPVS
ncbi:FkbM family methyltransferase [Aestuariivirga sp.]|uniref:FkbM family methyltransferase n=1 Tax=Aestuariivirga sp. TaxID=2650926 RepID=UPI00359385A0